MVLVWFLLNVFGVGVSCRSLFSFVVYFYVSGSGSITSVGEERANLSAVVYLWLCGFCLGDSSSSGCLGWAALIYCGTP